MKNEPRILYKKIRQTRIAGQVPFSGSIGLDVARWEKSGAIWS